MELRSVSEIKINGLSTITDNATEMDPNKGNIATLWQAFDTAVPVDYKNGERVYGVYSNYESDHQRLYSIDFEYYPNGNEIEVHIAVK
jgi:hypothetical protein